MAKRVVGIRFKKAGRMYYFDPGSLEIDESDGLIVETAYGIEFGEVVLTPRDMPDEQIVAPLKSVLRVATQEDRLTAERNAELEQDAFLICQNKVAEHKLDMKLVNVEYSFNGSKITFFFTAEGRVDFRELVKDLASVFKTRIELRQIGVRDEAKMLGGLGSCGRPVCCKEFLSDFQPVSIKMAKEQKLSLSPTKISGLCGRLMCCLKYEQEAYEHMRRLMPRINREVLTPDGRGIVLDNNVITERTKVRITLPDGTPDVREYHFSDTRKPPAPGEEEPAQMERVQMPQVREEGGGKNDDALHAPINGDGPPPNGGTDEKPPARKRRTSPGKDSARSAPPQKPPNARKPRQNGRPHGGTSAGTSTGASAGGHADASAAAPANKPANGAAGTPAGTTADAPQKEHRRRRGGHGRSRPRTQEQGG